MIDGEKVIANPENFEFYIKDKTTGEMTQVEGGIVGDGVDIGVDGFVVEDDGDDDDGTGWFSTMTELFTDFSLEQIGSFLRMQVTTYAEIHGYSVGKVMDAMVFNKLEDNDPYVEAETRRRGRRMTS